ncbi:beta-galactosidase [Halopelagius fulvigenes]|uniref:beta-galactosidase n=1 Tax=Halopelagius fulvigenes TaxID=1198324 RepID=A0ABD5U040_9EURY
MSIGVCYFPEHWPEERMEADVERMADAGLEYVRMGEFAWARMEPEPGTYDFEWLDRAVSLIGEYGMRAVLCTPTASPPKWLVDEHPGILQEEADGTTRHYGGRRHYCYNSEEYRRETRRITEKLAERYADNPTVAGWQTDNEYGCHGTLRCYCDDCAGAFRDWLREKYGDVDELNEKWGTEFWSQTLNSFAQVDPPRHTAADHHPSRLLDYDRFSSDSVVEYNRLQVEILREANDEWFVTHNFMSHDDLDAYDVAADLDFASWDSYPTGHVQVQREAVSNDELRAGNPDNLGLDHDLYRSAANAPFWVMEQQPGDINWPPYSPQPGEGAMRLWALYAVARGADVVSYFRWRRCRMGQEQYHSGLLDGDGTPDRGYRDAVDAASDLDELASVAGDDADGSSLSTPDADVALLHDYDNLWALDIEPMTPDFDYWRHVETYYAALRERSVHVDVVPPTAELAEYDAVVAPTLYLVTDELAETLTSYVEGGGELLVTMRSGVKDAYDKLHDAAQPGPLRSLVGADVEQHESVPDAMDGTVVYDGREFGCRVWNEWLSPAEEGAEVTGRYDGTMADGTPAIVRNAVGDGSVTYVGTWPDSDLAGAVVGDLLDRAGVETTDAFPAHVRVSRRGGLTWIANFGGDSMSVDAPADAEWALGGSTVGPYDVAVTDADPASLTPLSE